MPAWNWLGFGVLFVRNILRTIKHLQELRFFGMAILALSSSVRTARAHRRQECLANATPAKWCDLQGSATALFFDLHSKIYNNF
jgi:hypothetical protein